MSPGAEERRRGFRVLCVAAAAALALACGGSFAMEENAPPTLLVIFDRGREVHPDPGGAQVKELIRLVERQLEEAESVLRLAVDAGLLRSVQSEGVAIEIRYGSPRTFRLERHGRSIEAERLLVPLTGELPGAMTTILVGDGTAYRHGPYRNRRGTADLATIATALAAGG